MGLSYVSDNESIPSKDPDEDFKLHLQSFLKGIQVAGSFSTFEVINKIVLPGLHVTGMGDISLPISEGDACRMIAGSKQAAFGRGNDTVVDVSVRRTWELESIEFRNPDWQEFLETILSNVRDDLGVATPIKAQFHKLLIYEKGAMFKSHRDTEKAPGMFGTMVICLPSSHEGGKVELCHGGKTVYYHTDEKSAFAMSYLAWYSDIAHEIHPISTGYQVVLTYNLIAESGLVSASGLDEIKTEFKQVLAPWQRFDTIFLIHKLEHQYTDDSLSKGFLKGNDAKSVRFLDSYYEEDKEIVPLLANMRLHVTHGGRIKETLTINHIRYTDGVSLAYNGDTGLTVPPSRVLQKHLWRRRQPDKQSSREYTGNNSTTPEKEYHDTVIILVKLSSFSDFLLGEHPDLLQLDSYAEMLNKLMSIESKCEMADSLLCKIYHKTLCQDDNHKGIAACCALYKQRADWFSSVVVTLRSCFSDCSYKTLGRLIDVDNPMVDLDELSSTFTRSASVYDAWINTRAFISGSEIVRKSITLHSFTQSIMLQILKTSSEASDKDGKVMKQILRELDGERKAWKSFMLDAVKCFLKKHAGNRSFVIAFFLENSTVKSPIKIHGGTKEHETWETAYFLEDSLVKSSTVRNLVISVLPEVCELFELKTFMPDRSRYYYQISTLEEFLSIVQNHSQKSIPMVLDKILSQATELYVAWFWKMLRMMLKHDAAPAEFCQKLATLYLTRAIGPEPSKPTDWTRSEKEVDSVHCYYYKENCQRCQAIRRFVMDPSLEQQVFSWDELYRIKGNNSYLDIANQGESGWLITKTDNYWKKEHDEWSAKIKTFRLGMKRTGEDVLTSKLGIEKDSILRGECLFYKQDNVSENGSPPAKRLKVSD